MKSKGQNLKITQIIQLSQNYKLHRHNLDTIKPAVDSKSKSRQTHYDKLAGERLKYRQASRNFGKSLLDRENTRIVNRLAEIAQEDRNKRYSEIATYRDRNNDETLNKSRSSKRLKSASSSKSLTSVCSNFRRRTLRQK